MKHLFIRALTWRRTWMAGLCVICLAGCDDTGRLAEVEPGEERPGAATTVQSQDANSFSMPAQNLSPSRRMEFFIGNALFRNTWVAEGTLPASRSGAGPLLNTDSCQSCHIKDGRGHPPAPGSQAAALASLVRLSIPATAGDTQTLLRDGVVSEPVYGGQLQDNALGGHPPEGRVLLEYHYSTVQLQDGTAVELRKPALKIGQLGYGPMHPHTLLSLRVASPMIGLGLLEAIDERDLLDNVARQARAGGVSGRLNYVRDVAQGISVIGRFGWKAGQPNLNQQNAAAFAGDMGLTTTLFRHDDCTPRQELCWTGTAHQPEVSDARLSSVLFYTRMLAVPARRNLDRPSVQRGKALFQDSGCTACHRPAYVTGQHVEPELSGQLIFPYSDLLLHDMGDGLADGRPEFLANGQEWRTPPLWGLGLTQVVNAQARYLHDGRARTLLEAILWHGGEAHPSREKVRRMPTADRDALLDFLKSL
ncbi:c-type cytochrome [Pseudomonas syringae]|nr:c-type cytochrome [Pseudomonas syringae]MBD8803184.1 c-type cytochrome [Pseudomonas syringae]MBD8814004.1 c-type cytochrome [Pseudomonas syringae]